MTTTAEKNRKREIRARMAETGEPYTVAARRLDETASERARGLADGARWANEYATADELVDLLNIEETATVTAGHSICRFESHRTGETIISMTLILNGEYPWAEGFVDGAEAAYTDALTVDECGGDSAAKQL
ncbi:hypothetical protein [Frankia tisae]|uniref:hypothetical protein n=1 Tax=Frankia tisae TaxID=2950104 RepID=UPI0021C12D28|nr:hypothetical protein [Frankia tisae]